MKVSVDSMKVQRRLAVGMFAVAVFLASSVPPAVSGQAEQVAPAKIQAPKSAPDTHKAQAESTAQEGSGGMRVYRDPVTGEYGPPPPDRPTLEVSPEMQESVSRSSEGLVETPSPVPGGGVMIDLKGRFQSPMRATRDAEGNLSIQHMPETPGTGK